MNGQLHTCPACGESFTLVSDQPRVHLQCPFCSHSFYVEQETGPREEKTSQAGTGSRNWFDSGIQEIRAVFKDLKQISFKEEILPIDGGNVYALAGDFVFWAVTLLGIIPLLIVTIDRTDHQLTMFALFFAFVWGVIFKRFVLNDGGSWKWAVASMLFTGVAGIWLLLFVYRFILPGFYLRMSDSENSLISLLGYVFQVGLWEELFKAIPVFLLIWWRKSSLKPMQILTVGIFSGLGFAAFENLYYGENAVYSTYSLTRDFGVEGLVSGVTNAMVVTMLRSISLVFCHAVWSGIVAYFISIALLRKHRVGALILSGILVAAVLHGIYDWFAGIQPTIAALLAGFSFALFYGYLSKLKLSLQSSS